MSLNDNRLSADKEEVYFETLPSAHLESVLRHASYCNGDYSSVAAVAAFCTRVITISMQDWTPVIFVGCCLKFILFSHNACNIMH